MPGLLPVVGDAEMAGNASDRPPTTIPSHPLGVRPAGNAYTSTRNLKNSAGMFSSIPDELIMSVMEHLEVTELLNVGFTCKALYAFSRFDELWKSLLITEFNESWTDKPFILTEPVKDWPVYKTWDERYLRETYGRVTFRAEAVEWPLHTYLDYMEDTSDESPLYLFDHSFVEKMQIAVGLNGAYRIPECFGEDLFATLGDDRPDSRWLIIGPKRGGSTFHKDPNATSAWNAVIRGSKYWIMFPTSPSYPPPPGVYVSEDQSEVTSPLSIAEWLLEFHAEARATIGCIEGICHEGEVLHVPSGWWHLVVNLGPSVAITQNFVPQAHLAEVLLFLKSKPDQVSGFKKDIGDPYGLFVRRMKEEHSEILTQVLEQMERVQEVRKRKWDEIVKDDDRQNTQHHEKKGFSFEFGDKEDSDVP
ncbi:hypothetical protein MMC13_007171 [Lambiella insularis]|nr:hypothetical protein [Lambiella insularis]